MKKIFISALSLVMSMGLFAQNSGSSSTDDFKPSGKPVVTIFTDFSNTSSNGKSNNAFELTRGYFGYGYNFSREFSGKIVMDVAASAGLNPSAFTYFVKNAYLEYGSGTIKADLGVIGTTSFSLQESMWGKRYIYKSLQDQYGFQSSADLGAKIAWQPVSQVSVDAAIFNGEGYKKVQADSTFQFAAGVTVQPVKNLFLRAYYDYMNKQAYLTSKVAQSTFNLFAGYKSDDFSIGAEYENQVGVKNVSNQNWSAVSFYATYNFAKQFTVFGRYDNVISSKIGTATTGWNSTDGQVYLVGLEYLPVKGIMISPNFRYSTPTVGKSATSLNLSVGLSL